jgi:pimeloyl-ACP methyl ester carboxylesterase
MLLFCPGLICDPRLFEAQLAAFPQARAVETYGLADSLADMARITLSVADEAGAERFDLFGHSMGGRIALEVYRRAPERVRRVALVSTGIHPVGAAEPAKRGALQQLGHDQGFEALVDAWLPPMVAEANRTNDAMYRPMRQMCLDQGQAQFDAQVKALLGRPEVASLLPRITCPTLVMTGEQDGWAPPQQHQQIAAAIPDSELVIVAGAGHMLPAEAPEAVNAAIAAWLKQPAGD